MSVKVLGRGAFNSAIAALLEVGIGDLPKGDTGVLYLDNLEWVVVSAWYVEQTGTSCEILSSAKVPGSVTLTMLYEHYLIDLISRSLLPQRA